MRTTHRVVLLTALAVFVSTLTACSNFDPDKLDVFGLNEKKKLPGERKDVFPGGVPGVTQGIPPELRGNQPSPDAAQSLAHEQNKQTAPSDQDQKTATVEPEPKPKPKPKRPAKPKTAPQPAQATEQPASWPQQAQPQPPAQQNSQAPWPSQGQTNSAGPWPSSPQPGTFSR
jgi:outer membrane biosynthesis protein TonB